MTIQLSDHFDTKRLFRFVLPSIAMMLFTSLYSIVDGYFVSNYAGKTPFAGLNLIAPALMMVGAFGFMMGSGGTALVAKKLGEGDSKKANEYFSLIVYTVIIFGVVASLLCEAFLPDIARLLGAEGELLTYAVQYGRICFISMTFFMMQNMFQAFLITAEKPQLGLAVTISAGVANIFLDFLFVGVFGWGVQGAAFATAIAEFTGGTIPLIYFCLSKTTKIRLGKTKFYGMVLTKAASNGVSELMSNVSMSLMSMLFNRQLLRYFGENGVSAYGVVMYIGFLFVAIYLGYSIGVAPIVGFNYGAENHTELQNIFSKSIRFISIVAVSMFVLSFTFGGSITKLFTGYDVELWNLTKYAFRLYCTCFLLNGFNIFGSAFFTALNNGLISAIISLSRTLVFQIICIYLLPVVFGMNAIWLSVTVSEVLSLIITVAMILSQNKKYHYLKEKKAS